jgi:arylsulfatase A-like enzyme
MTRREFAGVLGATATGAAQAARPNIVVILTDDLGLADLGCYGSKEIRTPFIDRLSREGVRFTHAYSNAPVCSPTRAALMTGRYQHRLGIEYVFYGQRTAGKGLLASEASVAGLLRAAGYRTGMAGKWHLGAEDEFGPNVHGFEEFFGFRNSDHDYYTHRNMDGTADLYENNKPVQREGYSTDLFGDWASRFVRRQQREPFFLYAAFNAPHWPFQPPGKPDDIRNQKTWNDGTRADYIRMVESLDRNVGRILGAIEESGKASNTLVIFTNDNGGDRLSDNGPAFHHKFTVWEGGIRVPLAMRWPGVLPPRSVCGQTAITMDLTATMLAAAGVAPRGDRPMDGIDLLPIASSRQKLRDRTLFWRHRNELRAVRQGDWKLVRDAGYDLLFEVQQDLGERNDLAVRMPEKVAELLKLLAGWEAEMAASKPPWQIV